MKRRDFLAQTSAILGAAVLPSQIKATVPTPSDQSALRDSPAGFASDETFTPSQINLLEQLGDALLPLDEWIKDKHYIPENNP